MTAPTDRHMEEARRLRGQLLRQVDLATAKEHSLQLIASALAAESARSYNDGIEAAAKKLDVIANVYPYLAAAIRERGE